MQQTCNLLQDHYNSSAVFATNKVLSCSPCGYVGANFPLTNDASIDFSQRFAAARSPESHLEVMYSEHVGLMWSLRNDFGGQVVRSLLTRLQEQAVVAMGQTSPTSGASILLFSIFP